MNIFEEIMVKNFPKLKKSINLHIQEAQSTLSRINSKIFPPRYIIIKQSKAKKRENPENNKK